MAIQQCVIVNYKMGNTWSVRSAVQHLGIPATISDDPELIAAASHLILPGVGSFAKAMKNLTKSGIAESIKHFVERGNGYLLGICLGMQLMGASGTEDGFTPGLGLLPFTVERFQEVPGQELTLPHVGFNSVHFSDSDGLFSSLDLVSDFYFVHSFRVARPSSWSHIGVSKYGEEFLAAAEIANVCGVQFHPEKSQSNGLKLLKNFLCKN